MTNALKTTFLLALITALFLVVGEVLGGQRGMILAFGLAVAMNFFSYFYSDKIALTMSRAQPVTREQLPRLYQIVERLCGKANLPMPKLYVTPDESPNAFATGRNPQHASVAVTHGILNLLNDDEMEGVIAHELGHVRNRDILISSVAATVAGAITMLARMAYWAELFGGFGGGGGDSRDRRGGALSALAMLILAPVAAMMIQLAISRSREYGADATGAHLTGNPYALASALAKLDAYSKRIPMAASPSTAHLWIVQPRINWAGLFSTHPPIPKRIEKLTGQPADLYIQR